jgi:hypothetical protein
MEVERGDVARVAVLVVAEGVNAVGNTIVDIFWWLEGNVGYLGLVVADILADEPRGSA